VACRSAIANLLFLVLLSLSPSFNRQNRSLFGIHFIRSPFFFSLFWVYLPFKRAQIIAAISENTKGRKILFDKLIFALQKWGKTHIFD